MAINWMVKVLGYSFVLAFLTIASGCFFYATSPQSAAPVKSTGWEQTLRDIGFVSIWPPQEDVRVGDFYAYSVNPEGRRRIAPAGTGSKTIAAATRWDSLPVISDLKNEYKNRPSLPKTSDLFYQIQDPKTRQSWEEPLSKDRSIFQSRDITRRLRLVGLDSLPAITFTEGDLNALLPVEIVNVVLGSAWKDAKAVMLSPGPAESYTLPLNRVFERLLDEKTVDDEQRYFLKPEHRRNLALASQNNRVWLQVVNEVLYVRNVDFAITAKITSQEDEELLASELQPIGGEEIELQKVPADQETKPAESSKLASTHQEATITLDEDNALDPIYGAFVRAQAINRVLFESNADNVPGTATRFLSVTDESVSLRRVWQRGLAIGVRGITLEVDIQNGEVLRLGPMGASLPKVVNKDERDNGYKKK